MQAQLMILVAIVALALVVPDCENSELQRANRTLSSIWMSKVKSFLQKRLIDFSEFKQRFHKEYRSPSEESMRHAIFIERLFKVSVSVVRYFSHQSYTYKSINSRSDMTERERKQLMTSRPVEIVAANQKPQEAPKDLIHKRSKRWSDPLNWFKFASKFQGIQPKTQQQSFVTTDLRTTDCFQPPGDQGECESCATFVAIAQLEYLHCRETGTKVKFSEQFPVDCGAVVGMMGCGGTDVVSLNKFISQIGLMPNSTYPYTGRNQRCPFYRSRIKRYNFQKAKTLKMKREGIISIQSNRWSNFLERKIPLHVGIMANDEFEDYGGGVARYCDNHGGAHGMLLIGEGRENGEDYWLLRNSYGEWGEAGHFRLSKTANHCISDNGVGYFPAAFLKTYGSSFIENYADFDAN